MVLSLLILTLNVMVDRPFWWLGYHGILLVANVVMYRRAAMKLARAKQRQERDEWLEAMHTAWGR